MILINFNFVQFYLLNILFWLRIRSCELSCETCNSCLFFSGAEPDLSYIYGGSGGGMGLVILILLFLLCMKKKKKSSDSGNIPMETLQKVDENKGQGTKVFPP